MKDEKKKWKSLSVSMTTLPSIYEFVQKPLEAGLWCLYVNKHELGADYLTYEKMERILQDFLDIPMTAIRIKRAFAPAGLKII